MHCEYFLRAWIWACFIFLLVYGPAILFLALWEAQKRIRIRRAMQEHLDRRLEDQ